MSLDSKFMLPMSSEMKEALQTFAQQSNRSAAEVVREAIATAINYDNSAEQSNGRQKFANAEERKAAYAQKQKDQRQMLQQIKEALRQGKRAEAIEALEKSLKTA